MGKLDEMRRLREAQHAQQQDGAAPGAGRSSAAKIAPPSLAEDQGRCSVCGKVRALNNGLVSNHQKGLGKACPGSRKAPA